MRRADRWGTPLLGMAVLGMLSTPALCLPGVASAAYPPPPPPSEGAGGIPEPANTTPGTQAPPPPPSGGTRPTGPTGDAGPSPSGGAAAGSSTPSQDPITLDQRTPTEDLGKAWGYSSSRDSPRPNYTRTEDDSAYILQINPIGYYQGVTPAGVNMPPFPPQVVGTGAAVLTWTGFKTSGAGSQVFLQLSAPVDHQISEEGLRLRIELPNTTVNVKNNRRALDTSYFRNTPVTKVKVERSGANTVVWVWMREEIRATTTLSPAANGYQMLTLTFPATDPIEAQAVSAN